MRDSDRTQQDRKTTAPHRPAQWSPCLASLVEVDLGALSHVGKVRENNEDHYLVGRLRRSLEPLMTSVPAEHLPQWDEVGHALLVADGMGGAAAGEVASGMAVSVLMNLVGEAAKWGRRIDADEAQALTERLGNYYSEIHSRLIEEAQADPRLSGMGTTLTLAYSFCKDLFIAHVGDSRAYLFRQNELHQLTCDHTLAQALAARGQIAPEAVAGHRFKHVLTNVLGGHSGPVQTEIQHMRLEQGDRLLLCSDGLTDMVTDAQIARVLTRIQRSDQACRALVDLALEAGGKDNVTVVAARYSFPDERRA
ncbi:MAG: stp 1 [Acidobacteria bacterium]|nr:stp 1 [Acidobacteriota bacterium]